MTRFLNALIIIYSALIASPFAYANSEEDLALAKDSQNPIGNLIALPIENNLRGNAGSEDGLIYDLTFKPVYPIMLFDDLLLINRGITSFVHEEERRPNQGDETGWGDTVYQAFFSPQNLGPKGLIWGVGPQLGIPTATNDRLGAGKWTLGPTAIALTKPGPWLVGALTSHSWSFEGKSNRDSVNFTSFQYFINYNFAAGFYFTSNPTITANWDANSRSRWTVPFGGGIGKLFRFGKQPVDLRARAFYSPIKPDGAPPWRAQIEVKLLFPK
jgi:hypothetical protein